jgi:hypothetical protein
MCLPSLASYSQSFSTHQMQASQACSTKVVGGSKSTHGASNAKMEQNCKISHLSSQEWENVQKQMEWTQL